MSTKTWTLFLDDEREPTWHLGHDVTIARSHYEATEMVVLLGIPEVISFDHDLGSMNGKNLPTGKDFLGWLIKEHLDGRFDLNKVRQVIVHSANPIGARNIAELWNGFSRSVLDTEIQAELRPRTSNFK